MEISMPGLELELGRPAGRCLGVFRNAAGTRHGQLLSLRLGFGTSSGRHVRQKKAKINRRSCRDREKEHFFLVKCAYYFWCI